MNNVTVPNGDKEEVKRVMKTLSIKIREKKGQLKRLHPGNSMSMERLKGCAEPGPSRS